MYPLLPPDHPYSAKDVEKEPGFVAYAWWPPLCPWCAQWLRQVDFRPIGLPFVARTACPSYHGLFVTSQMAWMDLRPPKNARGGDGAWWTSLTVEQLRSIDSEC